MRETIFVGRPRQQRFRRGFLGVWIATVWFTTSGCQRYRDDLEVDDVVQQTWTIDDVAFGDIVQFENVFWEPDDTISLRRMIIDDALVSGREVLEIGTGTGLIAIVAAQNGALKVTATDINPTALSNAKYNAAMLGVDAQIHFHPIFKTSPGAFSGLKPGEKFDVIVSNPPWEDGTVATDLDHAFYDPGFALMDSLLDDLPNRLHPGGRCFVAYGHVAAIERLITEAKSRGFKTRIHDERKLSELPGDFLPGMLVEVQLAAAM